MQRVVEPGPARPGLTVVWHLHFLRLWGETGFGRDLHAKKSCAARATRDFYWVDWII